MLIGACTCVKDEELIILEWVAHYVALGIRRIHIFDNGSTDNTIPYLVGAQKAYPFITWEPWPSTIDWHSAAFAKGIKLFETDRVDWAILCDADEFLCSPTKADLSEFLQPFCGLAALGVNWAFFGSSGLHDNPGDFHVATFIHRAEDHFFPNHHIKSIIQPQFVLGVENSHSVILEKGFCYVNVKGEVLDWRVHRGLTRNPPLMRPWRFQHYFCRNRLWWDKKTLRSIATSGFSARTEEEWKAHDRNEVTDLTGTLYAPDISRITNIISSFLG